MSNETIIVQQTNLFLNVAGRRITALPDTGTIATMEKITGRATAIGGLHQTVAHIINGSKLYRFTINVMPMSADDQFLHATILAIENIGRIPAVSLTYETTTYVSGGCSIETEPTRNYNADSLEPVPFPFIGQFQIARVGKFSNPPELTAEQIQSQIVTP